MKESQYTNISWMNPFLVPKKTFEDVISNEITDMSNTVHVDWIHLYRRNLNDIEVSLLTKEAQNCVIDYTLDGYWCCLYTDSNNKFLPDWWDNVYSMMSDEYKGTSIVSSEWLDSLYKERFTKYVEELNVNIVVDIEKLKEEVHRFPTITLRTPRQITKDLFGISDEIITESECNYIKGYLEDSTLSFHHYTCIDVPTLQEIVLYDCKNHDLNKPYTYTYKSHDLYIIANVVYNEKKSKATITFTTKDNIIDMKYYIVWSNNFDEEMINIIDSITNNTKYFPKEIL